MSNHRAAPSLAAGAAPDAAREADALKLALTALAGASIEWYDFFLYATAAALVFPLVFFPRTLPPFVALIASFGTFAVGFVARPVGAVLFGHIGDRLGRKRAFAAAMILMGTATTLIGLLPSYASAGVFSPVALVLLRLVQGLAVGGQWGGAILLATESAPSLRRGLYGSITQAGVPVGVVLANLAFLAANAAMPAAAFMVYGWRIPFLFSIALVALGFYSHYRIEDTLEFRRWQRSRAAPVNRPLAASPVLEAMRLHPRKILLAAGAYISTNLTFYILIAYSVSYGTSAGGLNLPRGTMLAMVTLASAATAPVLLIAGNLSDRYGRRRIAMTGVASVGAWAFVMFPLLDTRSSLWIAVALIGGQTFNSVTYGPAAALFAELFDTRVRYSGVSLAYQIGAIIGGGLAPLIATALYARYHTNLGVSIYMALACAVSLLCMSRLRADA